MATDTQESAKLEQLSHLNPDEIEVAAGREREQLEGWVPELATEAEIREALEKAFDYRGDITITRKDGSPIEGYLFDRRSGSSLSDSFVRIIPNNAQTKVNVAERGLLGHRRDRFYRPGHRRRQDLRSMGRQVLGEEGRRRAEHPDRARETGLG